MSDPVEKKAKELVKKLEDYVYQQTKEIEVYEAIMIRVAYILQSGYLE